MPVNNTYYVDMKQRFEDFKSNKINLYNLHPMVYDVNNIALAVRQLSKADGRNTKGPDGTIYTTLSNYSLVELAEIVKDRLLNKTMTYVKRVYIPKKNGKMRPLGICSIWDKLVEMCIKLVIEPYCETKFVDSSYAYREQISTFNALAKVKSQSQTCRYALSIDLENYFGSIDPNIAYREMWHIGIKDKYILNYIFRFIKKGYIYNGTFYEDKKGCPQGSILGPLIANIYLHRFDVWFRDQGEDWWDKDCKKFHNKKRRVQNLLTTNLKIGSHIRYADDILILCKSYDHAKRFQYSITNYLEKNLKLKVNTEKTKIYDLDKESMIYLGYGFKRNKTKKSKCSKQNKVLVINFIDSRTIKEIVNKLRENLNILKKNPSTKNYLKWNSLVLGLHNYYCGMNNFHNSFQKIHWRIYKKFYHILQKNTKFEKGNLLDFLDGRYSTWGKNGYYVYNRIVVINPSWANWNPQLIHFKKQNISKCRSNPYDYKNNHKPGVSNQDIQYLVNSSIYFSNSKYAMFRISKYSASKGRSYISGDYINPWDYHCHHIKPKSKGGTDDFDNLCVLSNLEHSILHSNNYKILYTMYPDKKKQIDKLLKSL